MFLPVGLVVCLAVALLLARPQAAPAQGSGSTPPPLPDVRSEALPATVIVGASPTPTAAPSASPAATRATRLPAGGPEFMGAMTCSSSLCHGGGGIERGAYTIWKRSDPHQHSAATLAGTRAARIAQGLALVSAAGSARCTECHLPLASVPEDRLAHGMDVRMEGVTCESCHGPAQNWIRSHTRRDFTHAQNVQTGERDLRGLYARANVCVACHQVLAPDLLTAGHPPLLFELDGQTDAEPRHWIDPGGDYFGPQAWLTGQAVALREMSWALGQNPNAVPEAREQWRALVWLLQRTRTARGAAAEHDLPGFDAVPNSGDFNPGNVARTQSDADDYARAAAHLEWSRATTRRCLDSLAGVDKEFVPVAGGDGDLALRNRAQRLALALSRLMAPLQKHDTAKWATASQELDQVFAAADARMIFDGNNFADHLKRFSSELAKIEAE